MRKAIYRPLALPPLTPCDNLSPDIGKKPRLDAIDEIIFYSIVSGLTKVFRPSRHRQSRVCIRS